MAAESTVVSRLVGQMGGDRGICALKNNIRWRDRIASIVRPFLETRTRGRETGSTAELKALSFAWLDGPLPDPPWSKAFKDDLTVIMLDRGRNAISSGDIEALKALYADFVQFYPFLMIDDADIEHAASIYSLLYLMLWRTTQRISGLRAFNDDAVLPFSNFIDRHFAKYPQRQYLDRTPRVAFLTESNAVGGSNAVSRITLSLMLGQKEIRPRESWPLLYSIHPPTQELLDFMRWHDLDVRDVSAKSAIASAQAVADAAEDDDIDIIVSDNMSSVATIAFQRRSARVQAFHENGFAAWAISQLDFIFLGITKSAEGLVAPHTGAAHTPRNTAFVFQKIERSPADVEGFMAFLRNGSGMENPRVIFGFYGRMSKITSEYMAAVELILSAIPDAIFFAGGTGTASIVQSFRQSSPVRDRIVFLNDYIDGHIVSAVIDVFLDTFPFPGGMSCIEAQARGVPVVWMGGEVEQEFAIVADQRDDTLRAFDITKYAQLAIGLVLPDVRFEKGRNALLIARQYGDMRDEALLVEGYLQDLWRKAGK